MAQIFNPWDEEKDKQKQQIGTFNAGSGTTQTQPDKTEPTQKPQGSGLFTNIQKFTNQNQGLGQQLGANVQKQTNEASEKFGNIQKAFSDQRGNVSGLLDKNQQFQQQLQQDPTLIKDVNTFRKLAQGGLKQDVEGLSQYGQQAGEIQQQVGQTLQDVGTEQGRFGLLKNMFGGKRYGGGYGQGQQTLDQALLQTQSGDLTNRINQAKQQQADLAKQYNALTGDISESQEQLGTQIGDVQKTLTGELAKQQNAIEAANKIERQKLAQELPAQYQTFLREANKGVYDTDTMKTLGLYDWLKQQNEKNENKTLYSGLIDKPSNLADEASSLYGTDLGQFLKGASIEDIRSKDWKQFLDDKEAAKMSTLSNLSINPELGQAATKYKAGEKIDPFALQTGKKAEDIIKEISKRRSDFTKGIDDIEKNYEKAKAANLMDVYLTPLLDQALEDKISGADFYKRIQEIAPKISGGDEAFGGGSGLWDTIYRGKNRNMILPEQLSAARDTLANLPGKYGEQIKQYKKAIQDFSKQYGKTANIWDYNNIGSTERFKKLF
jgi:hypothetical protein